MSLLESIENYLKRKWALQIKPNSRAIMPVKAYPGEINSAGWPLVGSFTVLGHTLTPDGSVRTCQDLVLRGAWRAFWANLGGKKGRSLPCKMKLDLIDRAVAPVIFFRAARWPFTKCFARKLDATQRRMVRHVMQYRPHASESLHAFCIRRAKAAGGVCQHRGMWSVRWARGLVGWSCHVLRNRNSACWAFT